MENVKLVVIAKNLENPENHIKNQIIKNKLYILCIHRICIQLSFGKEFIHGSHAVLLIKYFF